MVSQIKSPIYFGCFREMGHYCFGKTAREARAETLWNYQNSLGFWDALLAPDRGNQREGRMRFWKLVAPGSQYAWPCYALSFWDRSRDTRPNSNSTFFFRLADYGVMEPNEALHAAQTWWPEVIERLAKRKIELIWESPIPQMFIWRDTPGALAKLLKGER